jgi:hypothetical protein
MNFVKIKNIFLKVMICCLVAAATVAVVTVLIGKFDDILERSLFTILMVAVHALISFGFISNNKKQVESKNLTLFINAIFGIIILSFMTALFGIWKIIPGHIVAELYELYFVLLFAIVHAEALEKMLGKQKLIDRVIYTNFVFMIIVVALFIPAIFTAFDSTLSSLYYRFMASMGIIDVTLIILTVILQRMYLQKHPKDIATIMSESQLQDANASSVVKPAGSAVHIQPHGAFQIIVYILAGLMALQIAASILFYITVIVWNH